jgi:hypothetical protein
VQLGIALGFAVFVEEKGRADEATMAQRAGGRTIRDASPPSALARTSPIVMRATVRSATWNHRAGSDGFRLNRPDIASGIERPTQNRKKGKTMST